MRLSEALLPGDMVALIEGGNRSLDAARRALEWVADEGPQAADVPVVYPAEGLQFLPPVPRPPLLRDFMGFETHLRNIYPKLGREIPPEWYKFRCIQGQPRQPRHARRRHSDPLVRHGARYRVRAGHGHRAGGINIPPEQALEHVFGYMIYNDFSERTIQAREMSVGLGPAKGKDFVRGHVLGPYLVTADEVPDIYNLRMVARVNDEVWCDTNSAPSTGSSSRCSPTSRPMSSCGRAK